MSHSFFHFMCKMKVILFCCGWSGMDCWVSSFVLAAPSACISCSLRILRLGYWSSFIHTQTNNLDKNLLITTPDLTTYTSKYKTRRHEIFTMPTNHEYIKIWLLTDWWLNSEAKSLNSKQSGWLRFRFRLVFFRPWEVLFLHCEMLRYRLL